MGCVNQKPQTQKPVEVKISVPEQQPERFSINKNPIFQRRSNQKSPTKSPRGNE